MHRGPIALNDRFLLALDDGPRVGVVTAINEVDTIDPPTRTIGVEFGTDLRRVTYEEGVFRHIATACPPGSLKWPVMDYRERDASPKPVPEPQHGPRVTRFDVSAQMLVDMLIPYTGIRVKSARAIDRPGFGNVVAFEVEHECVDIPAGYVSICFRDIWALGGARVSIFHAADPAPEPVYPRAPYKTPMLEAAYKASELLELFADCTPEERATVLDYLDAEPRPAPRGAGWRDPHADDPRKHPVDVAGDYITKVMGAELDAGAVAQARAHADEPIHAAIARTNTGQMPR